MDVRRTVRAVAHGRLDPRAIVEDSHAAWAAQDAVLGALTAPLYDHARKEAARLVARLSRAALPLAGVTVAVKDMIDVTPAACCAGLPFLGDYRPARDAEAVRRLRRAGALVIGAAATDCAGFDVRTAAVANPVHAGTTVGGSSGGAAAAVAAGDAQIGLGTDSGGSVRIPAACCALAGFKPSLGLIPTDGVRPLARSLDHVGLMARCVDDIAAALPVLADEAPGRTGRVTRILYEPDMEREAAPPVRAAMRRVRRACAAMGLPVEPAPLPLRRDLDDMHLTIFAAEATAAHMSDFAGKFDAYPRRVQRLFQIASETPSWRMALAERDRDRFRAAIDAMLGGGALLLAPTLPVPPPLREARTVTVAGEPMSFTAALIRNTLPFNHAGTPVLSLPVPERRGPPVASVQIVGRYDEDARVLAFAARLEKTLAITAPDAPSSGRRQRRKKAPSARR
jgi:Asp-tRNA(Asn)/Glu-tRNA(Gln) amidotransferase A subunit family amidase